MLLSNWLESREGRGLRVSVNRLCQKSARRRSRRVALSTSQLVELLEERCLLTLAPPIDTDPASDLTSPVIIHGAVLEGAPKGTAVGVTALANVGNTGAVTYALMEDAVGRFQIHPTTGVVTVRDNNRLNFEITSRHRITVRAMDSVGQTSFAPFFIDVIDDSNEPNSSVIAGNIWNDLDSSGVRDSFSSGGPPIPEPELDGQLVVLLDSSGNVVAKSVSYSEDRNLDGFLDKATEQGFYAFGDLPSGTFTVRLAPSQDFRLTFPNRVPNPQQQIVVADSNSAFFLGGDFGLVVDMNMATITGQVWNDLNGDGIHDTNEPGLLGEIVEIRDSFGNILATAATGDVDLNFDMMIDPFTETGIYSSASYPPDDYRIRIVPTPGRFISFPGGEANFGHDLTIPSPESSSGSGTIVTAFTADFGLHEDFPPGTPVDTDPAPNRIQEGATDGSRVGIFLDSLDPDGGPVFFKLIDDAGGRFAIDRTSGMVTVTRGRLIDVRDGAYLIKAVASSPSGVESAFTPFTINVVPNGPVDPPYVSVFGRPDGVVEANFGARFVPVRVVLNKPSDQTVTVQFAATSNPTLFNMAAGGAIDLAVSNPIERDYYPVTTPPPPGSNTPPEPLTLTFAPGQLEQVVRVQIAPDELVERDEIFFVELMNPTNATLSLTQRNDAIVILDDDAAPRILMKDVAMIEGDTIGSRELVFTAEIFGTLPLDTRSDFSSASLTVEVFTENRGIDTAIKGVDYLPISQFITFTEFDRIRQIRVPIAGDLTDEPDETVSLILSYQVGLGGLFSRNMFVEAVGTIVNDDSPNVEVAINSAIVKETDGPSQLVELRIVKVGKSNESVSVNFRTEEVVPVEFRATIGEDFQAQQGTVTFAPNEVEKSIFIRVFGDRVFESDEEFLVRLVEPTNATINPDHQAGRVTIRSNDKAIIPDEGDVVATDIADQLTEALANAGGDKSNPVVVSLLRQLARQVVSDLRLTRALVFIIDPVDFVVSDPQGRRVGYTEATGTVNEVPGAYYSGNGPVELIVLPVTEDGDYNVQLTGLGGDFNYSATVVNGSSVTTTIFSDTLGEGAGESVAINVDSNNAIPVGLGLALRGRDSDSNSSAVSTLGFGSSLSSTGDLAAVLAEFNASFDSDDFFNSSSSQSVQSQWQGLLQSARTARQGILRELLNSLNPELGEMLGRQQDASLGLPPELMDMFWQRLGQSLTGVPSSVYQLGDLLESLLPGNDSGGNSNKPRNGNDSSDNSTTPKKPRRATDRTRPASRPNSVQPPRSSTKPANNSSSQMTPSHPNRIPGNDNVVEALWRWLANEQARSSTVPSTKTNS